MSMRDSFDISPQQYHAGLDKLWVALGLTGPQDEDVFTLAVARLESLAGERDAWRYLCDALELLHSAIRVPPQSLLDKVFSARAAIAFTTRQPEASDAKP